ncbi:MAG: SBBP repeat-containing protein [Methylococcaceae bacterium]|nr:SBBP repeat-containing protein [Methylococcaceae bacterium]
MYSTLFGGKYDESGQGIAVDGAGNAYVTGYTSGDFPTVNAIYPHPLGYGDAFVFKLSSDGQTVFYSTYIGGSDTTGYRTWADGGASIAVDGSGNAYVTGYTTASDFPTVNAKYPHLLGTQDGFVFKLSSDGRTLLYSTYAGGNSIASGNSIAVDGSGNAYVTGSVSSVGYGAGDFPMADGKYSKCSVFVFKLSGDGQSVLYSVCGDTNNSLGNGGSIAVDRSGNVYLTGSAAYMNGSTRQAGASVIKLSADGQTLLYSAHFGSNEAYGFREAYGSSIAVDGAGSAYVTGWTTFSDFPTSKADPKIASVYPNFKGGGSDGFIIKFGDRIPPLSTTYGPASSITPFGSAAEPVNTATGNYYYQHADLTVPGRGMAFTFTRTYNAQDNTSGPLGRGWSHNYNLRLTVNGNGSVVVKQADGHEEFYDPNADGSYLSRYPGVHNTLVKNVDGSFSLTNKEQIRYVFSSGGKLAQIADRNGNALGFSYDGVGNLVTIVDTVGRTFSLAYDASNRLVQLVDPTGRKVQYAYDADSHLISDSDPMGAVQTYIYDANHRLTKIVDRRGNTLVENAYDGQNRVITQKNGKGNSSTFAYDSPNAGDTTITDALGHAAIHTHDTQHRLVKETDALGHAILYGYDADNNRAQVTDKNGNLTVYAYDARGNVTAQTDAAGKITAIEYDALNNPTKRTDALGGHHGLRL